MPEIRQSKHRSPLFSVTGSVRGYSEPERGDQVGDTHRIKSRFKLLVEAAKSIGMFCDPLGGERYNITRRESGRFSNTTLLPTRSIF